MRATLFNSEEITLHKSLLVLDSTRLVSTSPGTVRATLSLRRDRLESRLLRDQELIKFRSQMDKLSLDLLMHALCSQEADLPSLSFLDRDRTNQKPNLVRELKLTCLEKEGLLTLP